MASLKSGDIVRFSYNAPDRHDTQPIVLYLDQYKGLIHAINFNYASQGERRHFYLLFKVKYYQKQISPLSFYKSEIKGKLKSNAYRTYNPKYISGLQIVKNVILGKDAHKKGAAKDQQKNLTSKKFGHG